MTPHQHHKMTSHLRGHIPPGVQEKKSADFLPELSTVKFHSRNSFACGKTLRHRVRLGSYQLFRTIGADSRPVRPCPSPGSLAECLRPARRLGYPSRVCSITGEAVDRIAEAIDQLASDARGESSGPELASRVAELWLMVSALDPELARRSQHYTTPADGTSHA